MTKFFLSRLFKPVVIVLLTTCLISSCIKVDNEVGSDIIPDDDKLTLVRENLDGFKLYTKSVDSFRVDNFLSTYIGSLVSPRTGKTDMAYTTEVYTSLTSTTIDMKDNYKVDSIVLKMKINKCIGNYNYPLTVHMYELEKNFRKPTNIMYKNYAPDDYITPYYSNFDYRKYIKDKPLASFTINPLSVLSQTGSTLLVQLPIKYGESFDTLSVESYEHDSTFRKIFKGFCFVAESAYAGGAILEIIPNETQIYIEAYDIKKYAEKKEKEKITFILEMSHISNDELYNQAVTTIKNDQSYASASLGVPTSIVNDSISAIDYSYVTGFGLIMSKIQFPIEKINNLKNQLITSPSAAILVTNATLEIPVRDYSIGALNYAVSGLATFYNFQKPVFMPDYEPENEDFELIYFGGKLDRTFMVYKMDVTNYIQQLLNSKTKITSLDIATADQSLFTDTSVILDNRGNRKIALKLTYCVSK